VFEETGGLQSGRWSGRQPKNEPATKMPAIKKSPSWAWWALAPNPKGKKMFFIGRIRGEQKHQASFRNNLGFQRSLRKLLGLKGEIGSPLKKIEKLGRNHVVQYIVQKKKKKKRAKRHGNIKCSIVVLPGNSSARKSVDGGVNVIS